MYEICFYCTDIHSNMQDTYHSILKDAQNLKSAPYCDSNISHDKRGYIHEASSSGQKGCFWSVHERLVLIAYMFIHLYTGIHR